MILPNYMYGGHGVTTNGVEFNYKFDCEAAAKSVTSKSVKTHTISAVCVKKED